MVKIKIAILDDDKKDLKTVRDYFDSTSNDLITYECHEYEKVNETFYNSYDLYVIDIELDGTNGFDVAEDLKRKCPNAVLIIHSKRNDLVFESFKFGVFFFVRKDHFEIDMKFCQKRLKEHFINIKKSYFSKQNTLNIPLKDIMYIEKIDHNIEIHLRNGKIIREKNTIKQISNEISYSNIIQCHQSFLVNLSYVNKIDENDFIINNKRIQISRRYYSNTKKAYIEFLGKKVQI